MSNKPSDTLTPFIAENVIDYTQGETGGEEVSSKKIQKLQEGVSTICKAGYPELQKEINENAPKLVRAALDSNQLSWPDAAKKIVDPINPPKNEIVDGILNNINSIKEHGVPYEKVATINRKNTLGVSETRGGSRDGQGGQGR